MNYYNDSDPAAAEWLRELVAERLIPDGDVDTRDIISVAASDLKGYTQCHFFAGIGGWSLALQLAGWPEDKPVWTGSCPCQPFSAAGKQLGIADERDLWPAFFRLIAECKPEFVFGEQVENAIRYGWLDRVYTDMEGENYSIGAAVLGAHSVGAPHRRYRLYWGGVSVSYAEGYGRDEWRTGSDEWGAGSGRGSPSMANNEGERFKKGKRCGQSEERSSIGREFSGMADGCGAGLEGLPGHERNQGIPERSGSQASGSASASGLSGFSSWSSPAIILCRDGKARRVPSESLLFRMADGLPESMDGRGVAGVSETGGFPLTTQKEGRAMLLKGYGNAIVPQVAAEFIRAFIAQIEKGGQHEG